MLPRVFVFSFRFTLPRFPFPPFPVHHTHRYATPNVTKYQYQVMRCLPQAWRVLHQVACVFHQVVCYLHQLLRVCCHLLCLLINCRMIDGK